MVGVGHLGQHHARILASRGDVDLVGVADVRDEQVQAVARQWNTRAYLDHRELLPEVDAAVIAVPTVQHRAVASEFLERGISVLVEKPLATNLQDARYLAELAARGRSIVQVGHIERFNPAWLRLGQESVEPKFIQAERLGPYTFRSTDIGVVLDLMIHDLDLILHLVQSPARRVEAMGVSVFGRHEDIANARIVFENGCIAELTASRVSYTARRRMQLWSAAGFAGIDFAGKTVTLVRPTDNLRRAGAVDAPSLAPAELARLREDVFGTYLERADLHPESDEPLAAEIGEFITCLQTGARPRVGGAEACAVIALAEAVLTSLAVHQWEGTPAGPVGPYCLLPGEGIQGPHWQRQSQPIRELQARPQFRPQSGAA